MFGLFDCVSVDSKTEETVIQIHALVLGFFPDSTDLWFVNSGRTIHLLDNVGSGTPVYNIVVGQRSQDILTKTMNDPSGKFTWNSDTGNVF